MLHSNSIAWLIIVFIALADLPSLNGDYGQRTAVPTIMNKNLNQSKKMVYEYDLISGKVNKVTYQPGYNDQWSHRYYYDAENRLTEAYTSIYEKTWEREAKYEYHLHGPLARTTLGQQQVQGIDYAYTLQGWLKGMNSTGATSTHDIGQDAQAGSLNQHVAGDAMSFALNYFGGEYKPIHPGVNPFPAYAKLSTGGVPDSLYRPLYNGNISSMATYIKGFENNGIGASSFYNYKYDQLNRLTRQDVFTNFDRSANSYSSLNVTGTSYRERVAYDANGNITGYLRHSVGYDSEMDSLNYKYYPGTNQLRQVRDRVADTKYPINEYDQIADIDNQSDTSNYVYDEIGNLIQDKSEGNTQIKWNVYGKITEITRTPGGRANYSKIVYGYDAQGNRISKIADKNDGNREYTWYVRDAQGNLMSTYGTSGSTSTTLDALILEQKEKFIFGSSRLGVQTDAAAADNSNAGPQEHEFFSTKKDTRGWRQYELSNHLGNVLSTISDKKIGVYSTGSLTLPGGDIVQAYDYYNPEIISSNDYYPFGMPSRINFSTTGRYNRFGFNGKENDFEAKGWMNQQDYGMRVYDARLGRFLSFDPLSKEYNDLSPYHFAGNNPIQNIDLDGGEPKDFMENWKWVKFSVNGSASIYNRVVADPNLGIIDVEAVYDNWSKQSWFIHQGNNGINYYWKHNPGEDQKVRIAGNGKWVEFKTQNQIQYANTRKLTEGIALGLPIALATPFAVLATVTGVSVAYAALEASVVSLATRAALAYYKYSPLAAGVAKTITEILDESGQASNVNATGAAPILSNGGSILGALKQEAREAAKKLLGPGLKVADNKLIQHAQQWGLVEKGKAVSSEVLSMMRTLANHIFKTATTIRQGTWGNPAAGGFSDALFYFNGKHIVVTQADGTMITILRNAGGNKHYNNANIIWESN